MKNKAIIPVFISLVLVSACCHRTGQNEVPLVGITFSGTVTEVITPKVGNSRVSVFNASSGAPIASASATTAVSGASLGSYTMQNISYPDPLEIMCMPGNPNHNDAPVITLFLDNKNPNGKESFNFTSGTASPTHVLNITVTGGTPNYPYIVKLIDNAATGASSFDPPKSVSDGSHSISFPSMNPLHKSYTLLVTNTPTPPANAITIPYVFNLPDQSTGAGSVITENLTAF